MERRIRRSIVGVAIASIIVLGIPLGIAGTVALRLHEREQQARVEETILAAIAADLEDGTDVTEARLRALLPSGFGAQFVNGNNPAVRAGPGMPTAIEAARSDRLTLSVWRVDDPTRARVLMLWAFVVTLALVGLASAAALAKLQARRLTRPLDDLADAASTLGSAHRSEPVPRSGPPEIARIADALDHAATRVAGALLRERQFSANVAHQLRTPIAGLLLRLDGAAAVNDIGLVRHELAAATLQAERLSGIVDDVLRVALAAREDCVRPAHPLDLEQAVAGHVATWTPRIRAAGRRVRLRVSGSPAALIETGVLEQTLDVLLENARVHGSGDIVVTVRRRDGLGCITVADAGSALPADAASRIFLRGWSAGGRTGIGLGVARALMEANGGRLQLVSLRPTTFEIYLPLT
ncbi:MAG: sensor histidine kinase [Acidimicrobiia bacterium]